MICGCVQLQFFLILKKKTDNKAPKWTGKPATWFKRYISEVIIVDISNITIATDSTELQFSWNESDSEWSSIQYFYSWSGFNCENRLPELEDGQTYLNIETNPGEKPSKKHVQALTWLLAQPDAKNQLILDTIYEKYPDIKKNASAFFDSDTLSLLYPSIDKVNDLKNLISLSRI